MALLSVVEACHRGHRPGFIFNLDFFNAFHKVCLFYLDSVLEAMGFGTTFRAAVATLHSRAIATFLMQTLSREIPVEFLVRQGDPLAALLPGLAMGDVQELVEAYMVAAKVIHIAMQEGKKSCSLTSEVFNFQ